MHFVRNRGGVVSHGTEVGLKLKNNLDHATITALPSMPPGTPPADLTINKTAPVTVGQGARVTCTMTVSNKVPQPSTGSTVRSRTRSSTRRRQLRVDEPVDPLLARVAWIKYWQCAGGDQTPAMSPTGTLGRRGSAGDCIGKAR